MLWLSVLEAKASIAVSGFSVNISVDFFFFNVNFYDVLFYLQASDPDNWWSVPLASEECNFVNFEHHDTEGWDGPETFSSTTSNNVYQVSAG